MRGTLVLSLIAGLGLSPLARASAQAPSPRPDTTSRYRGVRDSTSRDSTRRDSSLARLSPDSLAARLERAEAALELLRGQLATEASTTVRTRSRLQIELWARILVNGFASTGPLNSADVPTYATNDGPPPGAARATNARALGITPRQSRLGLSMSVDSVAGGTFDGDIDIDFFGAAASGSAYAYLSPQPRLRTARFTMRWHRTELLVGSEAPLISELNPITVASVGEPGFADAGNLWTWLPQLRVTRELGVTSLGGTSFHWALQGAILDPFSGIQSLNEEYGVDAGERSGRPYLQSRFRVRWGADNSYASGGATADGSEIGLGVHRGWIRFTGDTLTASYATSIDARIGLGRGLEVRGEAYRGQSVAGLGGGGVGQNFGIPAAGATFGQPLRDDGGWTQLNWQARSTLLTGGGCGVDVPNAADHPERLRNTSCAIHMVWRPAQPLLFGVEIRHLRTTYPGATASGNHLNFAFGFEL